MSVWHTNVSRHPGGPGLYGEGGAQGEAVCGMSSRDWRRADSHGRPGGRGAEAAFVRPTLCASTGRRLPPDATGDTFQLRGALGGRPDVCGRPRRGAAGRGGLRFPDPVCLRITRQSFPEMESLRPQAMLTKIRIP